MGLWWLLVCCLLATAFGDPPFLCPAHCQGRIDALERRVHELKLKLAVYTGGSHQVLNESWLAGRISTEQANSGPAIDAADSLLRGNSTRDVKNEGLRSVKRAPTASKGGALRPKQASALGPAAASVRLRAAVLSSSARKLRPARRRQASTGNAQFVLHVHLWFACLDLLGP